MKIRYLISIAILTLVAGIAFAGFKQPAPVVIDLVDNFAFGDQVTARIAPNDLDFIGCGVRNFDDGVNSFSFGFCQAGDSDENQVVCFTENASLIATMGTSSAYSFITFSWTGDAESEAGGECIRVGFSTQSFYLPNFTTKGKN